MTDAAGVLPATLRAMSSEAPDPDDEDAVLSVHFGRSANCSSIGSVIDVLFVSGVVGTALLASLAILLGGERSEPDTKSDADAVSKPPSDEGTT